MSSLVVVQYQDLQHLQILHQGATRLKICSFDLCPLFLVLGANNGSIYVLNQANRSLIQQILIGKGPIVSIKVSPDDSRLAYALSNGIVEVIEISNTEVAKPRPIIISKEHEGHIISSLVWSKNCNEIYIGDTFGSVSVLYVPKTMAESLFRTSCVKLMTLDTAVTQLDFSDGNLLVSTITKSYICNTQLETFAQIGAKGRQGEYGGCFCNVKLSVSNTNSDVEQSLDSGHAGGSLAESFEEATSILEQSFKNSGRLGNLECDEAEEAVEADEIEVNEQTELRAFCARPGTRLWEVDSKGNVLVTHQLKNSLSEIVPSQVLHIDTQDNGLPTNIRKTFNQIYQSLQGSIAFTKVVQFHKDYLAAASSCGLFIIDPKRSQVVMWVEVSDGVLDLVVSGNMVMYHTGKGAVHTLIITRLDVLILMLHSNALYKKCSNLCLNNSYIFNVSKLLSGMAGKIINDLIANCEEDETKGRLEELKKSCIGPEEGKGHSIVGPITFKDLFISDKCVRGSGEEVNDGYDLGNHIFLPFFGTRWMNEPKMLSSYKGNDQVEQKSPSVEVNIVSLESSTSSSNTNNSNSNVNSTSNSTHSATPPQKSSHSNSRYSRGSFESSQEMYEDPLFPEDEEYDSEGISRAIVERKRISLNNSRLSNFYYPYAAPQGSETAAALQDIVENVASNVVDGITAGTKSLTEKLKNVTISPTKKTQEPSRSNMNAPPLLSEAIFDQKFSPMSEKRRDSFNDEILIKPNKFKKKGSSSSNNSPSLSKKHFSSDLINQDIDSYYRPSNAIGLIRNLHDLVNTTMAQVLGNTNQNETYLHLKNWLHTFCSTLQQIQENCGSEFIMQLTYEDLCRDGSGMPMVSDISYSQFSQPTSLDSLNWDSTDLGLDFPNFNSADIVNQVTHLFFRCMTVGVTTNNCPINFESSGCYGSKKAPQLLQSIHTPEKIQEIDIYYSQLIASDCGLLNYSYLMDSLETLSQSYYFHIWASLVQKLKRTSLEMKNVPLPDVVADLDFSRSQRVTFLYEIAMRDVKSFINAAAKVEGALILFDFIYFLTLIEDRNYEEGVQEMRINYLHLQQFLCQISMSKDVSRMYLDNWSRCQELQLDILAAIMDSPNQSNYLCQCGMPKPGNRKYPLENLLETIVFHEVLLPSKMAEMCLNKGCWSVFVSLNIKYSLQPIHACFPYILQSCDMLLLKSLITTFDEENFMQLASVLADLSTSDHSVLKCHRCETLLPITAKDKSHQLHNKSIDNDVLTDHSNSVKNTNCESESAFEKSSTESYEDDFKSLNLNSNICVSESGNKRRYGWSERDVNEHNKYLSVVNSIGDLWEVVVGHMVRALGSRETLKILKSVQDNIPSGVLPQKVFMWCILSSMVEGPGPQCSPDIRKTLMNNILNISPSPLSSQLEKELSTRDDNDVMQQDPECSEIEKGEKETGHHWGVHTTVMSGVCEGCHLALTTPALVNEGGITVFPCTHAYHAICLINTGRNCVLCTNKS